MNTDYNDSLHGGIEQETTLSITDSDRFRRLGFERHHRDSSKETNNYTPSYSERNDPDYCELA